jgi:hypothetical protein
VAADQFSFCVSLWEACCGARPYARDGLARLLAGEPEPPRIPAGIKLPVALIRALDVGLAAEPKLRWPNMNVLLDVLQRLPYAKRMACSRTTRAGCAVAHGGW